MTFGKVMGGGFPAAAFGGRADIMGRLAPVGPVYQAGTLSGNPVATAASLAQLRLLDDAAYAKLDAVSLEIQDLLTAALDKEGVAHSVQSASNMFSVFFTPDDVHDFESAKKQESFRFTPSSTRCSPTVSICRRRPSSPGSSRPPMTSAPSSGSPPRSPAAARAAAQATENAE